MHVVVDLGFVRAAIACSGVPLKNVETIISPPVHWTLVTFWCLYRVKPSRFLCGTHFFDMGCGEI